MRHVIVGSGAAGLAAAEAIRARDGVAEIVMVGREPHAFYSRPGLAYLLAGTVPDKQVFIRGRDEIAALRLDRRTDDARQLDLARRELHLAGGAVVPWDRLLLATGAAAIPPSFPGAELDGVVKLDDLDDVRNLIARAGGAKRAVVIGGGPTAIELAEGLRARGVEVHYLLRGARFWAHVLDPVESQQVEDALVAHGIALHHQTQVARVVGHRGKVAWVETTAGDTIKCDLVAVAIGVAPRLELARQAGLSIGRGVRVDHRFQTSAEHVYAAGDVAEVRDPDTGEGVVDSLWSTALAHGAIAGTAMTGAPAGYRRPPSLNVTRLGAITITIIGAVGQPDADDDLVTIARGDSLSWRARPTAWTLTGDDPARRVRVVVGPRHLVGALVMNDPAAARALTRLVRHRVDLSALRAALDADPPGALARLIELGAAAGAP
ncbi:MAG: FAD-dependent oxidoreductase [Deltaproteobacteria bacterium]|nr:FAD-dependent oxidoreductase [Deltaproteobacteria bacterium]